MATKKKRKSEELKTRKKKKGVRYFLLALIAAVGLGFLAFLGITLYDFIYPSFEKGSTAAKKEKHQVILFFSDSNERFLVPEKRFIPREKTVNGQVEEMVKALIDGPGEGLNKGLVGVFPDGTELKSVKVEKDGTAILNFNRNLVERHPGGSSSEVATVYALTNTLLQNLPLIKRVKLEIDGKVPETLKGHVDTRFPFTFKKELVKERSTAE
jgi:hypothetical protein